MKKHECEQEAEIKQLSDDMALIKQGMALVQQALLGGNGQIGIGDTIKQIHAMLLPEATFCAIVGGIAGLIVGFMVNNPNR